jgi:hypothetical protein
MTIFNSYVKLPEGNHEEKTLAADWFLPRSP